MTDSHLGLLPDTGCEDYRLGDVILLVYLFTVHLSFKACLVHAIVVIVFFGLRTSR